MPEQVPLIADPWMSPARRWLRRYGPTAAAATLGVAGTLLVWSLLTRGDTTEGAAASDELAVVEPAAEGTPAKVEQPPVAESTSAEGSNSAHRSTSPPGPPAGNPPAARVEPTVESPAKPAAPIDQSATDKPAKDKTPSVTTDPKVTPSPAFPPRATPGVPPQIAPPSANDAPPPADGEPVKPAANVAAERPAREPLRTIDVPARLKDKITKLDYTKTPLTEVLEVLSRFSTIPITIDIDAMTSAGIRSDVPVTLKEPNKTVEEALGEAVSSVGLRYLVVDQHILVTARAPSEATPAAIRRDVSDLAASDADAAEALAAAIRKLVAPASWQSQRTTSMRVDGATLVITQSPAIVREIDRFLAQLRAVRRDPAGVAKHPPAALQTHYASARATLDRKLTLNYTTPTALGKILARLQKDSGVLVLVDWQALAADDIGPETQTRVAATARPLEEVLAAVAEPLDLACRVIDGDSMQLTTRSELSARPQLEAYALADLAGGEASAAALAKALVAQFNSAEVPLAAHVDAKSETLFLLAPQDVQIHTEKLIAAARNRAKAK
jgi:hypothetical protein